MIHVCLRKPVLVVDGIFDRHNLLEIYRRQLTHEKSRRTSQRLEKRIMAVASKLDRFAHSRKMRKIG
jgi:hypothetical protein